MNRWVLLIAAALATSGTVLTGMHFSWITFALVLVFYGVVWFIWQLCLEVVKGDGDGKK